VAHVGADNIVAWDCQRPETALEDALRALSCTPGEGVSAVTYSLFHDGFRLRNFFADQSQAAASTGRAGECFGGESWRGQWSIGPETWAHAIGSGHGEYKGQIFCFTDSTGSPHISWIDYSTKIHAEAAGEQGGEGVLYDWWRQEAGPGHPTHIHALEAGGAQVVEGENLVTGAVVAIGRQGANITSATLRSDNGDQTELFFDPNVEYECQLTHLVEHQESGDLIAVPVERTGGRLVVTHFTHC
jgi:hypothetical protein